MRDVVGGGFVFEQCKTCLDHIGGNIHMIFFDVWRLQEAEGHGMLPVVILKLLYRASLAEATMHFNADDVQLQPDRFVVSGTMGLTISSTKIALENRTCAVGPELFQIRGLAFFFSCLCLLDR